MACGLGQRVRRFLRDDGPGGRGQAMVEFAIAFPLQLFLTFGIAQLGLIYVSHLVVNYAAYRACRAEIVGGDGHRVAQFVLSPLTSSRADGFGVQQDTALSLPGWGKIRYSAEAGAKTQVYTTTDPDSEDVTVVVEYHQELIFPVVDGLFALFLEESPPATPEEEAQRAFGILEEGVQPSDRVWGKGGPFIRDFKGTKYLVVARSCTMYRDPIAVAAQNASGATP